MSMPVEAKEVAVGDWSPNYGSVSKVIPHEFKGVVNNITIEFFSGQSIMMKPEQQIVIEQGGSAIIHTDPLDKANIRPGLKEDHAKG